MSVENNDTSQSLKTIDQSKFFFKDITENLPPPKLLIFKNLYENATMISNTTTTTKTQLNSIKLDSLSQNNAQNQFLWKCNLVKDRIREKADYAILPDLVCKKSNLSKSKMYLDKYQFLTGTTPTNVESTPKIGKRKQKSQLSLPWLPNNTNNPNTNNYVAPTLASSIRYANSTTNIATVTAQHQHNANSRHLLKMYKKYGKSLSQGSVYDKNFIGLLDKENGGNVSPNGSNLLNESSTNKKLHIYKFTKKNNETNKPDLVIRSISKENTPVKESFTPKKGSPSPSMGEKSGKNDKEKDKETPLHTQSQPQSPHSKAEVAPVKLNVKGKRYFKQDKNDDTKLNSKKPLFSSTPRPTERIEKLDNTEKLEKPTMAATTITAAMKSQVNGDVETDDVVLSSELTEFIMNDNAYIRVDSPHILKKSIPDNYKFVANSSINVCGTSFQFES